MFYRGKKRIRKEPDVFQKTFSGVFEQLRGSGMILALLLVAALVVMAAFWVASSRSARSEGAAQAQLTAALDQPNAAERLEALQRVVEATAGSQAEPMALLAAATLRHERALEVFRTEPGRREDELKRALVEIDRFIAEHPKHRWLPRALERRALILEDLGRTAEAAEVFGQAARAVPDTEFAYLRGKLLYGQARCQEKLQQRDEAVKTLELALAADAEDRGPPWRPSAAALLAQLQPAPRDLRVKDAVPDKPPDPPAPPAESKQIGRAHV
jgi:tetratricopeptide (TPR) repeat protein